MRVAIRYQYKQYPLSEKINKKSKRIGYHTSPQLAVVYGVGMGMIAIFAVSEESFLWVSIICTLLGLVILPHIRRSAYQKLDEEYIQLLKSMEVQKRVADVNVPPMVNPSNIPAQPVVKSAGNADSRKRICPHCGARQPEGTDRCKYCGTAMK